MVYKDKDKQKEAQRERTRRYRAKQKGVTSEGVTQGVTSQRHKVDKAEDKAGKVEPCMRPGYVCPIPEDQRKPGINYGPYMTADELATAGLKANRVSVPGDVDYVCMNPKPKTREVEGGYASL